MTPLDILKGRLHTEDIRPRWHRGAGLAKAEGPTCTEENCPSYDGKRCAIIGGRPSVICEPAVDAMAEALDADPVPSTRDKEEAEAAGCIVSALVSRTRALGPAVHLPNTVPAAFQQAAMRFLTHVGLDAWGRRVIEEKKS